MAGRRPHGPPFFFELMEGIKIFRFGQRVVRNTRVPLTQTGGKKMNEKLTNNFFFQRLKVLLINFVGFFFMFGVTVTPTYAAGIMKGWAGSIISSLGTPLNKTLDLYKEEGFILADVGTNYAVFSTTASRIDQDKRGKNAVQSDLSFLLSFDSCVTGSGEGLLEGEVTSVAVKRKMDESGEFMEELRELLEYTESLTNQTPGSFGASKIKKDQVFMSWTGPSFNIEIQLNKSPHQLVYVVYVSCPPL